MFMLRQLNLFYANFFLFWVAKQINNIICSIEIPEHSDK